MKGIINGKEFEATEFGFDGCHKIYLCDSEEGREQLIRYEYDLYPIEDLPEVWTRTCPLRFIMSGDLTISYVDQCEPAEFEGWHLDASLVDELELMKQEQLEANEMGW